MARFYGTVQGGRGMATRLGHATSGLHVTAQSFTGDVEVWLQDCNGEDHVTINVVPHAGSVGSGKTLYSGPFSALMSQTGRKTLVEAFARRCSTTVARRPVIVRDPLIYDVNRCAAE